MSATIRVQTFRFVGIAVLSMPIAAGALLLGAGSARAAGSVFTITCPAGDGAAGGAAVSGHGQCGTYPDSAPAVVTGSCQPLCLGGTTFRVTSPSGSALFSGSLDAVHGSRTYTVPAGSPDGVYTATLSGGGADVSASLVLQPATTSTTPTGPTVPSVPGGVVPTSSPTKGTSAAPTSASTSPAASTAPPVSGAGAAPPSDSGHAGAVGGSSHQAVHEFPALAPPAGIAVLPPLPTFPAPSTHGGEGVPGPYGKTLPYDGSVTVSEKPTLLRHVADTVDDKQFAESITAAFLALLFAGHLRRFARRPAGEKEL